MEHLSDDIPRLLTGEATRDEVLAAGEHLRACPDCQQELVSALVAHASLTSAQRFASEVVTPVPPAEPQQALPDLSAVFARAREEASAGRRPRRRRAVILAATAALVIGGTTVGVLEAARSGESTGGTTIELRAFGVGHATAEVTVTGRTMHIDASKLPKLDAHHFYEVWLTDAARKRMWPLGAVNHDNRGALPVPTSVMQRYAAIEVSVQQASQTAYSGVSVLRGTYK